MCTYDFKNINFGQTDAFNEGQYSPELLKEGYLDKMGLVRKVINDRVFLFLGYKGAGKTALMVHMKLTNQSNHDVFITDTTLAEFPYKSLPKMVQEGGYENEARLPIAWRWLLLIHVIHSLHRDKSSTNSRPEEWSEMLDELKRKGVMPITGMADLVRTSSKRNFGLDLGVVKYGKEDAEVETTPNLARECDYLKELLAAHHTDNKHYFFIDGLDDVLTKREIQYQSIAALINQAKELNGYFSETGLPFKIIVMCRTDIFSRLSDPNKNKVKRDYSCSIEWFDEGLANDYSKMHLVQLANLRCQLKYQDIPDMFDTFFPTEINDKPCRQYLLDLTRHTPRDFIQLLVSIQRYTTGTKPTSKEIQAGVRDYCLEYFEPEIDDEMAGHVDAATKETVWNGLRKLKNQSFKFRDFLTKCNCRNPETTEAVENALRVLLNCSAIGHVRDGNRYFKYRNPKLQINFDDDFILHKALWRSVREA